MASSSSPSSSMENPRSKPNPPSCSPRPPPHLSTPPRVQSISPYSRTIYSDRFIPSRIGSNFALFDLAPPPPPSSSVAASSSDSTRDDFGSGSYSALLRSVMFSPGTPDAASQQRVLSSSGSSSSSPSSSSPFATPSRNIFRFKAEIPRATRRALFEEDSLQSVSPSNSKGPRKVPRSPFKVMSSFVRQRNFG